MLTSKVEPIDRDIDLIFREEFSADARSAVLAQAALEAFEEAEEINTAALGGVVPRSEIFIDGTKGKDFRAVRPDGTIVINFDLVQVAVAWIYARIVEGSPVRTGTYQKAHRILVDGQEVDGPDAIPFDASEVLFVAGTEYARRLEPDGHKAWSKKAPNGIYMAVAPLAAARYRKLARITFTYRAVTGLMESHAERRASRAPDMRVPAILFKVA